MKPVVHWNLAVQNQAMNLFLREATYRTSHAMIYQFLHTRQRGHCYTPQSFIVWFYTATYPTKGKGHVTWKRNTRWFAPWTTSTVWWKVHGIRTVRAWPRTTTHRAMPTSQNLCLRLQLLRPTLKGGDSILTVGNRPTQPRINIAGLSYCKNLIQCRVYMTLLNNSEEQWTTYGEPKPNSIMVKRPIRKSQR